MILYDYTKVINAKNLKKWSKTFMRNINVWLFAVNFSLKFCNPLERSKLISNVYVIYYYINIFQLFDIKCKHKIFLITLCWKNISKLIKYIKINNSMSLIKFVIVFFFLPFRLWVFCENYVPSKVLVLSQSNVWLCFEIRQNF